MKIYICSMHGVPVRAFTKQQAVEQYVSLARAVGIDVTIYDNLELDIDDGDEIEAANNVVELSKFRGERKGAVWTLKAKVTEKMDWLD